MRVINKKLICLFLLTGLLGFLADRFIPHTHHDNGFGIEIDFSCETDKNNPEEDEEAGEKLHSKHFRTQSVSSSILSGISLCSTASQPVLFFSHLLSTDSRCITELYFLRAKITALSRLVMKYYSYKAPPTPVTENLILLWSHMGGVSWPKIKNQQCTGLIMSSSYL